MIKVIMLNLSKIDDEKIYNLYNLYVKSHIYCFYNLIKILKRFLFNYT